MTDESFEKPIVGVISTWAENTPCNIHLHDFWKIGQRRCERCRCLAGPIWHHYGCGRDRYGDAWDALLLTSRDIIADSIEAAMGGHNVDAFVAIGAVIRTCLVR